MKTAVLLGFCLELGARLGGASEEDAEHLRQFGTDVGLAFQLRDDLLDVYGDAATFGKRVGGDIVSDKKTFSAASPRWPRPAPPSRPYWPGTSASPVADADAKVQAVRAVYDELEIRSQTEALINDYFQDALQHLERVAAPAELKEPLRHLALQLMDRES
ncbi:MAG: polyprenyl synthetase family protein [Hymenobacter sp.]